ncbi:TPA_asm: hypothetical protein G1W88_25335 [Salmonella enterica subsp. enterica serovar Typhimurium str. SL1344]|nr:hypothetical protein [Salmonella enterica subsp. enterica serovar Typhimurium str. SL1344]
MTDEQKLYGLMAIVEEQQKTLDAALKDIQDASKSLAAERMELGRTVKNITESVGASASESLLNALGDAQRRFSEEMNVTTSEALKAAQNANQELEKAKKTVAGFTSDLKGTMAGEIRRAATQLTLIFTVIGALSLGGVYWYFLHQASKEQELAEYWIQKSNAAYEKCQKLRSCRD